MGVFGRLAAACRLLLVGLAVSLSVMSSAAEAQMPAGTIGWTSAHTSEKFLSYTEACRSQWEYYSGNGSKFIGAFPWVGRPDNADCDWTTYHRGCPQGCGTILPSFVWLKCQTGYSPATGVCLKDAAPERPCNCSNPKVGHPVVLSSGTKILSATDYESADGDFVIGRSYRSIQIGRSASYQSRLVSLAGGWNLDFAYEVQLASFSGSPTTPNAKLALVLPDGTAYDFVMQSGGTFVPDTTTGAAYAPTDLRIEYVGTLPSDLSTIYSSSTQWKLTDGDDTVWTFQTFKRLHSTAYTVGRPISRTRRDGYGWTFAYAADDSLQTITDTFGRQATFTWSQFFYPFLTTTIGYESVPEAVSNIALPDGTSLRFTYDPTPATAGPSPGQIQKLLKVERLNGSATVIDSTTYSYGDSRFPTHITGITDFNGTKVASYAYDGDGRGISSALASGSDPYAIANSETSSERVRSVTGPLGKVADYHFSRIGGSAQQVRLTSVVGQASVTTPASTRSYTYGTNNFIATETDEEGRVTSYTRDSRGRPTTIIEAYGTSQARTTTITWHSTFNVPTSIVQPGLTETRTYNSSGQLATVTLTDTTGTSSPYSTNGQTRTWTYGWGTGGRLASINGPRPVDGAGKDDTLAFAYDSAGNLSTSTNGLGQVTSFASYDANGRPGTMTDANGIVTAFTYDTLGRTKTVTVRHPSSSSLDAMTSFDYDIHDRVTGITSPATDKLTIDYDSAGRVSAVRTASGERIDYETDPHGNVTRETVRRADTSTSRWTGRTFDELGRMLSETLGTGHTSRLAYDKVDNATQVTSGRNTVTQAAFDPLNRLISTVAPDTGTTSTGYNALDAVTSHTDAISVQTTYVRDGFGDVIQEASPDRGTSTYYYNEAGQLTAAIDGRGQRVDYTRDILGRITSKTPVGYSAQAVTYTWDSAGISGSYGVGRLAGVTDATGTTSFAYDHRGNVITRRQTVGSGTADLAYSYDLADRITQIAYPSGRLVAYTRDTKGRVTQVSTKASSSDPSWTALASSITYEPWGSMTGAQFGNGLTLTQAWTDGRLTSKRLRNASTSTDLSWLGYNYDGNDNLGAIRDKLNDANSIYYGYDANDRLTLTSWVSGTTLSSETYGYTSGTNRLASLTDSSGTRSISYDARGNTSAETRPGSVAVSTSYDAYGRLLAYSRTGDPAQANAYNGLDDRVSVTSGSTTHLFVYDPDGRQLGEYGTSASDVIAETIWLSPEVAANDNQPLGGDDGTGGYAPLAVVTGSGSGAATYWVHGNQMGVPIVTTDATGATATPPAYTLPGFPGQMRTLADLYYNRYRDYDSSTGRYIQADPIGLAGGENPYLYAEGNPMRWADPWGLAATGGAVGGIIGGYGGCAVGGALGGLLGPEAIPAGCWIGRAGGRWVGSAIGSAIEDSAKSTILTMSEECPEDAAARAVDRANYHRICDEPPPPGLTGKALEQWKLQKALRCQKARQDFTDKWYGGKFDVGHKTQMDQLAKQIARLKNSLGL